MRVAIFCGSRSGKQPEYREAAKLLGTKLAKLEIGIVYGGGRVGLMGEIANSMMESGGEVIGVIPTKLYDKEVGHEGVTELQIVPDMHTRKATMMSLADAFIALPGGIGTMEEIFEVWTWAQIGYHEKPCGFFNVAGYYDHLFDFLRHSVEQGFVSETDFDSLIIESDCDALIESLSR